MIRPYPKNMISKYLVCLFVSLFRTNVIIFYGSLCYVSELFQAVFEKLPGVELSSPGDEDYPGEETLYTPGAEGRPVAGFQLQELMELIREVLEEGHYHDMGGEDEMYDALDPHGFDKMSDAELVDAIHTGGMEEMIVFDGEGGLANREEAIAALKDV